MANSKFEYVRLFERRNDSLLQNTWIVIRIDGRGFHKFSKEYGFKKPNDKQALDLMNASAVAVMNDMADIVIAYGVSDEFSFVLHKNCALFDRRESKLITAVVSTFTATFVHLWPAYFPNKLLSPHLLPSFDGRAVCYPSDQNLRDYMSWRQTDCHINNLYNTTFCALVDKTPLSTTAAEELLKGTVSSDRNEILYSKFGINYNKEPEMFRKGSTLYRDFLLKSVENAPISKTAIEKEKKIRKKAQIVVTHLDIIKDTFWEERPWILAGTAGKLRFITDTPESLDTNNE